MSISIIGGGSSGGGSANTGDITFSGVQIVGSGEDSGDGNGYGTIELVPDASRYAQDQYLVVDPTQPNHIHLRAGGTQDASNAELILGGEHAHVRVVDNGHEVAVRASTGGPQTITFWTNCSGYIESPIPMGSGSTFQWDGNTYSVTSGWDTECNSAYITSIEGPMPSDADPETYSGILASYWSGKTVTVNVAFNNKTWTFGNDGVLDLAGGLRFPDNSVQASAPVVIAGEGALSVIGNGQGNASSCPLAVIAGGKDNSISTASSYASPLSGVVIGGGYKNSFVSSSSTAGTVFAGSVIGGGLSNTISGYQPTANTIGGGSGNAITNLGSYSTANTIGGGLNNTVSGYNQNTIGGGSGNTVSGIVANTIGGGLNNTVSGDSQHTIGGGGGNSISGSDAGSTIGGGTGNSIDNGSLGANTIGGGSGNSIGQYAFTYSGYYGPVTNNYTSRGSVVCGGSGNLIEGAHYSSILGGSGNTIAGIQPLNVHIIGSNITADADNTTFVNNLVVVNGGLRINSIPTTNPGVPGVVWKDGGTLKIS